MFSYAEVDLSGSSADCVSRLSEACRPESTQQTRMGYYGFALRDPHTPGSLVDAERDVARFLLVRGPHAFLGTSWVGCEPDGGEESGGHNQTYVRPPAVDVDYGTPDGLCAEVRPGFFVRDFTKAAASHDCSTGKSEIVMKPHAAFYA